MPTKRRRKQSVNAPPVSGCLLEAIRKLATILNVVNIIDKNTTVSSFKSKGSSLLDRANQGDLEIVTRGKQKFLLLSADHVIAIAQHIESRSGKTMRELHPNLPFLPASKDRPVYTPLADTIDHLRNG